MNSQQLLLINFIIILVLVLFFTVGRSKPKQPVRLNLKSKPDDLQVAAKPSDIKTVAREVGPRKEALLALPGQRVFFMYNGHEWEAYEVLGLAAGSTLSETTAHYQSLVRRADASSLEFLEAAYTAILKKRG